jgi:transposase InsO family protein
LLTAQFKAFPWDTSPSYLLRDRDASYGPAFRDRLLVMGIKEVVTAPRSPWQNPYVERLIGSIRRECLDHIIIFNWKSKAAKAKLSHANMPRSESRSFESDLRGSWKGEFFEVPR